MREVRSSGAGLRLLLVLGLTAVAWAIAAPPRAQADAPCTTRYTILGDGTVLDNDTKLTWQQAVDPTARTWDAASAYCQQLSLAGGGWRLPSAFELQTLVDEVKATTGQVVIDLNAFPGTPKGAFWSSPAAFDPVYPNAQDGWTVDFGVIYVLAQEAHKSEPHFVRCVR